MIQNITNIDAFLDSRVKVHQYEKHYKSGVDAVLLASIVELCEGIRILDMGSGVGVVSFCLLARALEETKQIYIDGLEKQKIFYDLAFLNKDLNSKLNVFTPICDNILSYDKSGYYDVIVTNPPYFKLDNQDYNMFTPKQICNIESDANIKDFISCAYRNLKNRGSLYIITSSSRLQDTLCELGKKHWGDINIHPIYSYIEKDATRFIVVAKKLSKGVSKINCGIVMHNQDGTYTSRASGILKNADSFYQKLN